MKQIYALLSFSLGVFGPNYLHSLPSVGFAFAVFGALLIVYFYTRHLWLLALSLGFVWGTYQANSFSNQMLPQEFDSEIFIASAVVNSVENREQGVQRLELDVYQLALKDKSDLDVYPKKALVNWYGEEQLVVGDNIVAEAKLRRPRGLQNPGLFDYQKWLISEGYTATGYLRQIYEVQPDFAAFDGLSTWRDRKISTISNSLELEFGSMHLALTLGDGSEIDSELWELFRQTGTVHLMVISGLHVGLVAGMGYLIGFGLGRGLSAAFNLNAVRIAIVSSLSFAFVYCAISGFGLPATRAFVMLAAFLVPRFFYLRVSRWISLAVALALVSVIEPRAVLQSGFWLSFGAVFLLFIGFSGSGRQSFFLGLIRAQILFLVGFSGILLWQGLPVPITSFAANIVAVPLVSFVLVPLEILALLASEVNEALGTKLWLLCDWFVAQELRYLKILKGLNLPVFVGPEHWSVAHSLAVVSGLLIWAAPGWALRFVLAIGLLPLFFSTQSTNYFLKIHVFDVGQGTAILIQQPGYNLLYDTGPKFSDRFDSGANIIAPVLEKMKVSSIDRLIVSHPDADHRGGVEGLLRQVAVQQIHVGKPFELTEEFGETPQQQPCMQGGRWRKDHVSYRYLWPDNGSAYSDNDSSCALLIEAGEIRILLPGDISSSAEQYLLKAFPDEVSVNVLFVPHHGSKSSSSEPFVKLFSPDIAIVSAGYRNQFNHPHPEVVAKYHSVDSRVINTAESGAIQILWSTPNSAPKVTLAANSKLFWWQK